MCKQPLETGGSWIVNAGIQGWMAELGGHLKMVGWKIRRSCAWKSLQEYGKSRFFSPQRCGGLIPSWLVAGLL